MTCMKLVTVRFDHPDARKLNDRVQAEYAERYGDEGDLTPLAPEMFDPPAGLYVLAYDADGVPIGTGGWRSHDEASLGEGYALGDAEIKRMYIVPEARGHGFSRLILAHLEETARAAGRRRMVLETGTKQPEAISLYETSGYAPVPDGGKFGYYRFHTSSRCYTKPLG